MEAAFNSAWAPSVLKIYKKADVHETYTDSQNINLSKDEQPWQQTTSNWRDH